MVALRVRPHSATTSLALFRSNSRLPPRCSISTQPTTRVANRARISVPKKCRLLTASNAFKTTSASSGTESIAKFLVVLVSIIYIIPIFSCFISSIRTSFLLVLVCLSKSGDRTDKMKIVRIRISAWLRFRRSSPLISLVFETKQQRQHKQTTLSYLVCVTNRFSGLNRYLKLRKPQARGDHSGIR